jgi:splicing factor 1
MHIQGVTRQSNLLVRKITRKIRIPIEEHPNYNFIGLIIGPRGKTQKELEAKTGCKIAIRGKGSVKEGARGRRDGQSTDGETDPLHVVVSGQDQKAVDAAADMVEQMLVVIDDEQNVHKQNQLRELALLNGTLKDNEICPICAETGHRAFECPKRFAHQNRTGLNKIGGIQVKCAICGDTSHPTRDCTQRNASNMQPGATDPVNQQELDSDYLSFMAELDGKKAETQKSIDSKTAPMPKEMNQIIPPSASSASLNLPPPSQLPIADLMPPLPAAVGLPPPPTPFMPPPPPIGTLPPPPFGSAPTQTPSVPLHGFPPPPPPPPQLLQMPPPQEGSYYAPNYEQNQPTQYPMYDQTQHQQPAQHVQAGDETNGWDPSSYYGAVNGGAGGFNWWEQ